jgi:hypothetical protein
MNKSGLVVDNIKIYMPPFLRLYPLHPKSDLKIISESAQKSDGAMTFYPTDNFLSG